jgi:hypothetical protein
MGQAVAAPTDEQTCAGVSLDGAYVNGWGDTRAVLVAVDLGTEQPVAVGYVNEKDPQAGGAGAHSSN